MLVHDAQAPLLGKVFEGNHVGPGHRVGEKALAQRGIAVAVGADALPNTLRSGASQRDMSDAAIIGDDTRMYAVAPKANPCRLQPTGMCRKDGKRLTGLGGSPRT